MKFKATKPIFSICLAAALMFASPSVSGAPSSCYASVNQDAATIQNKEEVVYADLNSNGSANALYAVNHFVVGGAGTVTDYGNYSSVENLTDTEQLTQQGDAIFFQSGEGNFYYRGNLAADNLPWLFNITYSLDGVQREPQDLADQSGKLEIHLTTKANGDINPAFYHSYMLQISITLDTDKCSDIQAPGAMIASSGKNSVITYTVMPGKDGDVSLTSAVQNFAMAGIQITAVPFQMGFEIPDTNDMIDDMSTLSDAIGSLNDGVKELNDGVGDLSKGAAKLSNGSAEFQTGLSQISGQSGSLVSASSQINDALTQIADSLNNPTGTIDLSSFAQLPDGLDQLALGLNGISGGLTQLKGGLAQANSALDSAISGVPNISQTSIEALSASPAIAGLDPSQMSTYNQLLAAYGASQAVKGTYYGPHGNDGVKAALQSITANLDSLPGSVDAISQSLSGMSTAIRNALVGSDFAGQMQQLKDGLTALSSQYGQFHSGLAAYTDGIKTLSSHYGQLHDGLVSLSSGTVALYSGTKELYDGTSELNDNVADLPNTMQTEIDNLLKDYDQSDFVPVSFLSEKNTNVSLVQFVLKTAAIEANPDTTAAEPAPQQTNLWDRLISLFRSKE